jgi:hypothetical protein
MSFGRLYASKEFMFCELHDALSRFLSPFRDYIDPLLDSNGYGPFVATLCIGIIAAMRAEKVHLFGLLDAYIVTLKTAPRGNPVQTRKSFSWFSFFFSKSVTRLELRGELPRRVGRFLELSHTRFEDLLRDTDVLFNEGVGCGSSFHEHYIFYLGIILASYKLSMHEAARRRAVGNLVDMHYLDSFQHVYDNFDSEEIVQISLP